MHGQLLAGAQCMQYLCNSKVLFLFKHFNPGLLQGLAGKS